MLGRRTVYQMLFYDLVVLVLEAGEPGLLLQAS